MDLFEGLSIFEKINKIKEIAKTNPEIAGRYCSEINDDIYKNNCFSDLAEITGVLSNCDLINRQRAKEECYGKVAIKIKDSSVCNRPRGFPGIERASFQRIGYFRYQKDQGIHLLEKGNQPLKAKGTSNGCPQALEIVRLRLREPHKNITL